MAQGKIRDISRSEAVENFSSAEQLDQRMVVIRGRSWLVLAVAVAGLLLALLWGILGEAEQYVSGEGLIIDTDHPVLLESSSLNQGVIDHIVPVGEFVEEGETVLVVGNPELDKQVASAREYLEVLRKDDSSMRAEENELVNKHEEVVAARTALSNETLSQTRHLVKMHRAEVNNREVLFEKQLIPNSELLEARASLYRSMQQVTQQDSLLAEAEASLESLLSATARNRSYRAQQIERAENELEKLIVQRDQAKEVTSPVSGRVIIHGVGAGSVVGHGTHLAVILPKRESTNEAENSGATYSAVAFLPFGYGKQVRVGMDALVSLPFARPSRYGYIKGTVTSVADFVSASGLAVKLGSHEFARSIQGDIKTPLEVIVKLKTDETTSSGLAWTSRGGYPDQIPVLTLCEVQVTVQKDRPIDLVIPWLKDQVGIDQPPQLQESIPGG